MTTSLSANRRAPQNAGQVSTPKFETVSRDQEHRGDSHRNQPHISGDPRSRGASQTGTLQHQSDRFGAHIRLPVYPLTLGKRQEGKFATLRWHPERLLGSEIV